DDTELVELLSALDDEATRAAVVCERRVLATLEAGCSAPLGALAEVVDADEGEELWIRAVALSGDGSRVVRMSATGLPGDAVGIGDRLGSQMLAAGAAELMEAPA